MTQKHTILDMPALWRSQFKRCTNCNDHMLGITCNSRRTVCHTCGGKSKINMQLQNKRLAEARKRLGLS